MYPTASCVGGKPAPVLLGAELTKADAAGSLVVVVIILIIVIVPLPIYVLIKCVVKLRERKGAGNQEVEAGEEAVDRAVNNVETVAEGEAVDSAAVAVERRRMSL